MKTFLLLPLVLAVPAFAGTATSSKEVVPPAPSSCLTSWFAGASVGYLTELEEPMYNLHVGLTNNCWKVAGWQISGFAEVGYTDSNDSASSANSYDSFEPFSSTLDLPYISSGSYDADLTIVPITVNIKFDRVISGNLNVYLGAGLGIAYTNLDVNSSSDSAWVFVSNVFGGLSYTVNPHFEIYGGARWMYFANPDYNIGWASGSLDLGSDCLLELGARYKF